MKKTLVVLFSMLLCLGACAEKPQEPDETVNPPKQLLDPQLKWAEGFNLNKQYDGQPVVLNDECYTVVSDGDISISWYEDYKAINAAPVDPGNYTVKVSVSETNEYKYAEIAENFSILANPLPAPEFPADYSPSKSFDGRPVEAPVVEEGVDIEWYQGAKKLDEAPKAAGDYSVKIINRSTDKYHSDGIASKTFTISPIHCEGWSNERLKFLEGLFVPDDCNFINITVCVDGYPQAEYSREQIQFVIYDKDDHIVHDTIETYMRDGDLIPTMDHTQSSYICRLYLDKSGFEIGDVLVHMQEGKAVNILDVDFSRSNETDLAFTDIDLNKEYTSRAYVLPENIYTTTSSGVITTEWYKNESLIETEEGFGPTEVGEYQFVIKQSADWYHGPASISKTVEIKPVTVDGANVVVNNFRGVIVPNNMNIITFKMKVADIENNSESISLHIKIRGMSGDLLAEKDIADPLLKADRIKSIDVAFSAVESRIGEVEIFTSGEKEMAAIEISKIEFSREQIRFFDTYNPTRELNLRRISEPVLGVDYTTPDNNPADSIKWFEDGVELYDAPMSAGNYVVRLIQGEDYCEKAFSINPLVIDYTEHEEYTFGIGVGSIEVPAGCHSFIVSLKNVTPGGWNNSQIRIKFATLDGYKVDGSPNWNDNWFNPGVIATLNNEATSPTTLILDFGGDGGFEIENFYLINENGPTLEISKLELIVPSSDPIGFMSNYNPNKKFNASPVSEPQYGIDYSTLNGEPADAIEWYQGDTKLDAAPSAVGEYTVKLIQGENSCERNFVITVFSFKSGWNVLLNDNFGDLVLPKDATKLHMKVKTNSPNEQEWGMIFELGNGKIIWQGNTSQRVKIPAYELFEFDITLQNVPVSSDTRIVNVKSFFFDGENFTAEIHDMYFY